MQCCDHMPLPLKRQIWKSFIIGDDIAFGQTCPPSAIMQFMNSPLHLTLLRQCNIFHPEHQALSKELSSPTPDHPLVYNHHSPEISKVKFCSLACFVIFFTFSTIMKCHHASINVKYDCFDFCLRAQMMRDRVKMGYTNCIVVNWEPFKLSIFAEMQTYF